jgi:hypothetical protein
MYKRPSILAVFLMSLSALVVISCERILDVPPEDVLEEKNAFLDDFSARSSVLGIYSLLQDVAEQLVILGELQGDLITVTDNADQDLIQVNEHNVDINNRYADPSNFFKIIVNCNEVIHKIHRVMETDIKITQRDLNSYLAEVILLRAWCYFKMVQIYGEIPYFEEPLSDYETSLTLTDKLHTLQTEDYVLDTILGQIVAIDTFDLNMDEESPYFALRMNKFINWSLQGEIYLWRNDYSFARRVYSNVTNIIAAEGWSGTYRLPWVNTYSFNYGNWKDMFRFDFGSGTFEAQSIFVIPFSKFYNQQHGLQRMFGYGEGGDYLFRPTEYIINRYQAQKIIKWEVQTEHVPGTPGDLNRGKGVSYDSIDGYPVVTKYALFKDPFDDDAGVFIYRAGEYHLGTCEAYCRTGQAANAMEHLNQGLLYSSAWGMGIRSRANVQIIAADDPRDTDEVENIILAERALELAFEGHRWFDLVRFARHKESPDFLADMVAEKFSDPVKKEQIRAKLMDEKNWFLPLKLD